MKPRFTPRFFSQTRILFPVVFLLLGSTQVLAQTTAFTYQGKLTDNGSPANGNYDLQFALFDTASGGAQIGQTQTVSNVTASGGVFTVTLDFGANAFPGASRFLEISTRSSGVGNFTLLTPRQPITSTPYAVRSLNTATADTATNAQQLGGLPANTYALTVDPRLSDPRPPTSGSSNYIQNGNSPQAGSNFNISGSGTAGGTLSGGTVNATNKYTLGGRTVMSFGNNTVNVGSGSLYNVTIGLAFQNPAYQLEVVGQYDRGLRVGTLGGGGAVLSVGGSGDVQVDANGVIGGRFIVKENGNVGIGQNSPGAKLEVGGNIKFTSLGVGGNTQLCRNDGGEISSCSSSLRYKTDLHSFTGGLNLINRLHPISFKWKTDQTLDLGLGAEDVAAVEPLLVTHNAKGEVEGVKYDRLSAVFINAFKEQQTQIQQQQDQISSLIAANERLSARLQAIEERLQKRPGSRRR